MNMKSAFKSIGEMEYHICNRILFLDQQGLLQERIALQGEWLVDGLMPDDDYEWLVESSFSNSSTSYKKGKYFTLDFDSETDDD